MRFKISVLAFLLWLSIFFSAAAETTIPFFDSFDVKNNNYTVRVWNYPEEYYALVNGGKMEIHTGGADYYPTIIGKSFIPTVSGSFVVEFTLNIPAGNYLMAYNALLRAVDLNGAEFSLIKSIGRSVGQTSIGSDTVGELSFQNGKDYRFRFDIDLDTGNYGVFLDSGNGFSMLSAGGNNTFHYDGIGVKKIEFQFDSIPGKPNVIYLDNLYVRNNDIFYYVSGAGDDQNNGSRLQPFRTPERALQAVNETENTDGKRIRVILLDGEYEFSENYRFDAVNVNKNTNAVVFEPMYNASISVLGNYENAPIPELSEKANADLRAKFLSDISGGYPRSFASYPLDIKLSEILKSGEQPENVTAGDNLTFNFSVADNGTADENFNAVIAFYGGFNQLQKVVTMPISISGGQKKTVSENVTVPSGYNSDSYVKIFVWDSLFGMSPLTSPLFQPIALNINIEPQSVNEVINISASQMSNKVEVTGNAPPYKQISVILRDKDGNLVYLEQCETDNEGKFNTSLYLDNLKFGYYQLYIACGR